jgi:hypothetical protein
MTRKIENPPITYTVSGFAVKGRKYKTNLVERGIFNPIPVKLHVTDADAPIFLSESKKIEYGIHRVITNQLHHEDYIWIVDNKTNPLADDRAFLTNEMVALRILNNDMRL